MLSTPVLIQDKHLLVNLGKPISVKNATQQLITLSRGLFVCYNVLIWKEQVALEISVAKKNTQIGNSSQAINVMVKHTPHISY